MDEGLGQVAGNAAYDVVTIDRTRLTATASDASSRAATVGAASDSSSSNVGTVAAGRIGLAVLRRLHPFDVHLHYTDKHRLDESVDLARTA